MNHKTGSLPCGCVRDAIHYYISCTSHKIQVLRTDMSGGFFMHSQGSRKIYNDSQPYFTSNTCSSELQSTYVSPSVIEKLESTCFGLMTGSCVNIM